MEVDEKYTSGRQLNAWAELWKQRERATNTHTHLLLKFPQRVFSHDIEEITILGLLHEQTSPSVKEKLASALLLRGAGLGHGENGDRKLACWHHPCELYRQTFSQV